MENKAKIFIPPTSSPDSLFEVLYEHSTLLKEAI